MNYSNYHDLTIELPGGLVSLKTLEIEIAPNRHATARFTAIVPNTEGFGIVEQQLEGQDIKISDASAGTIFAGIIDQYTIFRENNFWQLEMLALSASIRLDVTPKSQSFQEVGVLYRDIVKSVLAPTSQAAMIFAEAINETTQTPIIQYQETDWVFIKRLASHFDTMLIPEVTQSYPRFWFGMRNGKYKADIFPEDNYLVRKNLQGFLRLGGQEAGYRERDVFTYQVQSADSHTIGDTTTFRNKNMTICEKTIRYENGQLIYIYTLGYPKGFGLKRYGNPALQGASIQGTVLATRNELVKLHLAIDNNQAIDTAYEYPYLPITGNQLYSMPIIGTTVNLSFDHDNDTGHAVACVRTNGNQCGQTMNPKNRYFATDAKRQLAILPNAITVTDQQNTITLADQAGITMVSAKKWDLNAQQLLIISGANVYIQANSKLNIMENETGANLKIENEFDTMGSKGKLISAVGIVAQWLPERGSGDNEKSL